MTVLDPDRVRAAIDEAEAAGDASALRAINAAVADALKWRPQQYQLPPPGDWRIWVARWGRGAGKSDTGSWWFDQHMSGPPCDRRVPGGHRGAIVGPTFDSAISACVQAPAGVTTHNPGVQHVNRKDGTYLVWPNGAEAIVCGAHTENDAELLRGRASNRCVWWFDEAAIMRHLTLAIDMVALGARLGPDPRGIVTSTPKPYPPYRRLLEMPGVAQTIATTFDNQHLPRAYRVIVSQYEGTRLGRQELYAELLADFEGALWSRENIDADRVAVPVGDPLEALAQLGVTHAVVGVDPSTWDPDLGDDPGTVGQGIESGVVVAGIGAGPRGDTDRKRRHVYVLEDASLRAPGEAWARAAAQVYHKWHAADLVPETNLGGLVLSTIRLVDPSVHLYRRGKRVGVRASVGKRARAEPVAALYEQHRAHHVGTFPLLEDTMCQWDPRESWSPDRLDALVWAVTALEPWGVQGGGTSAAVTGSITR